MSHDVSVSERIYGRLKTAVLTGAFGDHARIDFAEVAELYEVSTTPVREAAMRLLGEGLLEMHPKGGARPLRLSEFRLRVLLNAHAAITIGAVGDGSMREGGQARWPAASDDEQIARLVFRDLVDRMGNPEMSDIIDRLSDRLMPYRLCEGRVLGDTSGELRALWSASDDRAMLRRLVRAYHRRRVAKVALLVWAALQIGEPRQHYD